MQRLQETLTDNVLRLVYKGSEQMAITNYKPIDSIGQIQNRPGRPGPGQRQWVICESTLSDGSKAYSVHCANDCDIIINAIDERAAYTISHCLSVNSID